MGWVDGFKGSGTLARISLLLIFSGAFFNWVAFTSTNWGIIKDTTAKADDTHIGVWRQCQKKTTTCYILDGYAKGWFIWFQVSGCLAWVGGNLSLVLILCFMFWDGCMRNRELGRVTSVTCVLTSLCWLFSVVWFGYKFYEDDDVSGTVADDKRLGFSHTIAIFAILLHAISSVAMLLEALQSPVLGKPKAGVHFQASASTV